MVVVGVAVVAVAAVVVVVAAVAVANKHIWACETLSRTEQVRSSKSRRGCLVLTKLCS